MVPMLQPQVRRWGGLTFSAEHDGGDAVAGAGVRAVRQLRAKQGGLRDGAVRAQAEQEPSPARPCPACSPPAPTWLSPRSPITVS